MSEHELRVQRSLQKLNVPEWYRNSSVPAQGFLLKRHSDAGQNQQTQHRWNASTLPSKTTSLSSLGSNLSTTPRSPTSTFKALNIIIKRYSTAIVACVHECAGRQVCSLYHLYEPSWVFVLGERRPRRVFNQPSFEIAAMREVCNKGQLIRLVFLFGLQVRLLVPRLRNIRFQDGVRAD